MESSEDVRFPSGHFALSFCCSFRSGIYSVGGLGGAETIEGSAGPEAYTLVEGAPYNTPAVKWGRTCTTENGVNPYTTLMVTTPFSLNLGKNSENLHPS